MSVSKISSTFSRVVGDEANEAISFDGYRWKVGITSGSNIEYLSDLDDLVKYAPLFVKYLTRDIEQKKKKIAISLPTESYYASEKKKDGGVVARIKNSLLSSIEWLEEVVVLPQGAIAFPYLASKGLIKVDDTIKTLIIDGGFNTLNLSIISGKNGKIIFSTSILDELGVYNLLNDFFRKELKVKYDEVSDNIQMLKQIFLKERFESGFRVIDVTKEKQRALSNFLPKLINRVHMKVKKENLSFEQFVFVGGISYYIDENSIQTTKNFYVPKKEGEFLTAKGMRKTVDEDFSVFDIGFGDVKYIL